MRRTVLVIVAACLLSPAPADAAFPGVNGKIAFELSNDIYVVEPDGSGMRRLTTDPAQDFNPAWSPDGQRLAFASQREGGAGIYVMNADGSDPTRLSPPGLVWESAPAWSPDGARIAFSRNVATSGPANYEIFVMNVDGTGRTRLTNHPAGDHHARWSPDGGRIAFMANRDSLTNPYNPDVWVMNADGSNPIRLTAGADSIDRYPSWSPDGRSLAYQSWPADAPLAGIFVMNADGSGATRLTSGGEVFSAWSPDGRKIAFGGVEGIVVMSPDGSGRTTLVPGVHGQNFDWQPLPSRCPMDVRVGNAVAHGCFTETEPGSGVFETDEKAWVGGFEVRPRSGGRLVVDTNAVDVRASGAGVDVVFAGFPVPVAVERLPVELSEATIDLGAPGTATSILDVPVKAAAKVAWTDNGAGASFEAEVGIDKLAGRIGQLVSSNAGGGGGKLKAKLVNGTGFVLEQAEVAVAELDVIPEALRVPRVLKLRNLLLRYELRNGRPFWTGRAGISLPLAGRESVTITGTVFVFDGAPAGGGIEVDGLNWLIPQTPLFLQTLGGDLVFAPDFGLDLRMGASVGPRIAGRQLIGLNGTLKAGTLAAGCTAGIDPVQMGFAVAFAPLDEIEQLGLASVSLDGTSCMYVGPNPALEMRLVGGMQFVAGAFAYEGSQSGFVSRQGASLDGATTIKLPALPDLSGRTLISTQGVAACAALGWAQAGFGYRWGQRGVPTTFTGCDLGPYQVPSAPAPAAAAATRTRTVRMPPGLPHAALRITGASAAPRVRVTGPGGFRVSSPGDAAKALRRRDAIIVPVAHERATYVLVRRPRAGRWRIRALGAGATIRRLALARGLPAPRVRVKVRKARKGRRVLTYRIRRLPGQRVRLFERGPGIARALPRVRGRRGRITFRPSRSTARRRTIEAQVTQNRLPRASLTVARYTARKLRRPAKPRVRARRTASALALRWRRVPRASSYLIAVHHGGQTLHRVLTRRRRAGFAGVPATGALRVTVQAISKVTPPSRERRLVVKAP